MGIRVQNSASVSSHFNDYLKRIDQAFQLVLADLGMELVALARTMHSYTDRTGNLTNSIGYAVIKSGNILTTGGMQGGEGEAQSLDYIRTLASQLPQQYSLVIVAGMDYAAYVEAKGYNVLLPARLAADRDFKARMDNLISNINNRLK